MAVSEDLRLNIKADVSGQADVDQLSNSLSTMGQKMDKTAVDSGKTTYALTNFSRVIQDAPFGMIAVANNLEGMVQGFLSVKKEAGSTGGALKALFSALSGPGGLVFGIGLVSAAFSILPGLFRSSKKANDELSKSIEDSTKNLQSLKKQVKDVSTSMEEQKGLTNYINGFITLNNELDKSMAKNAQIILSNFDFEKEYFGKREDLQKAYNEAKDKGLKDELKASVKSYTNGMKYIQAQSSGFEKYYKDRLFQELILSKGFEKEFNSRIKTGEKYDTDLKKITAFNQFFQRVFPKENIGYLRKANKEEVAELQSLFNQRIKLIEDAGIVQEKKLKSGASSKQGKAAGPDYSGLYNSYAEIAMMYEMMNQEIATAPVRVEPFDTISERLANFTGIFQNEMETLAGIGAATDNILQGAFGGVRAGMEQTLQALITGQGSMGEILKKMTQQAVLQLAVRSGVEAIFQTAQGLGKLAFGDPSAALHFKSAATFAGVAVAAGLASKAIGSGIGGGPGGGGGSTAKSSGISSQQTVNIYGDVDKSSLDKMRKQQEILALQINEAGLS